MGADSYLIHVVCDHKNELIGLSSKDALTFVECLVHKTRENPDPEYKSFDKCFYKYPSYMRRSSIHAALGHVSSHETRCSQYCEKREAAIKRGWHYKRMEPAFTYTPCTCPTLYRKETFKLDLASGKVRVKVFVRGTWDWITLQIPNRDGRSLIKAMVKGIVQNPKLVFEYGKFYLEFPVKYNCVSMPETSLERRRVLSADLGINNGAVCSIADYYGTIHGRFFEPFKADTDRILHVVNLIKKYQRLSGKGQSLASLYTKLRGLKDNYIRQLARWIVDRAIDGKVYGIVLEHLDIHKGKKRGSLAERTHHWCVAKIRDLVKGMAFRAGIRVFFINPKGTSMYAYDGTGKVSRDKGNYSMCTFASGKRYNCDLSASYNIASRYFLREIKKSVPATVWSELMAKVPELSRRTNWTLSTLRSVTRAA